MMTSARIVTNSRKWPAVLGRETMNKGMRETMNLPAWMIDAIERQEREAEQARDNARPRLDLPLPLPLPSSERSNDTSEPRDSHEHWG